MVGKADGSNPNTNPTMASGNWPQGNSTAMLSLIKVRGHGFFHRSAIAYANVFIWKENANSHEMRLTMQCFFSLQGLQTSQDARFYALSSRFDSFSNEGKPVVIQFTVKHEQKIDCGGGYVKIFPADLDQTDMHGDSQYYIMFGKSWLV